MEIEILYTYKNNNRFLLCNLDTTVHDLKQIISNKLKLSTVDLEFNKSPLDDDNKTLSDYGIQDISTIDVKDNVNTEPTTQPTEQLPEQLPTLIIQIKDERFNDTIQIQISLEQTVFDLKRLIKDKTRLNESDILLIYNKTKLSDDNKLSFYGIKNNSEILLFIKKSTLYIKQVNGPTMTIEINLSMTVEYLKHKISSQYHIDEYKQELIFNGVKLNDENTLSSYGIKNESTIHLVSNYKLYVKQVNGDPDLKIEFSLQDTVLDLKHKIKHETGIDENKQQLVYSGKILTDSVSLGRYGIENGSTLHLVNLNLKSPQQAILPSPAAQIAPALPTVPQLPPPPPPLQVIPTVMPWKILVSGHGTEYPLKQKYKFPFKCLKQYCDKSQTVTVGWSYLDPNPVRGQSPIFTLPLPLAKAGAYNVTQIGLDNPEFIIEKIPAKPNEMTLYQGGVHFDPVTSSTGQTNPEFVKEFGIWLIKPGSVVSLIKSHSVLGKKMYYYMDLIKEAETILKAEGCPDISKAELCICACRGKTSIINSSNIGAFPNSNQLRTHVTVSRGGSKEQAEALMNKIKNNQLNEISSDKQFLQVTADQYHYYVTNPETTIEDTINSLTVNEVMELMETNPKLKGGKRNRTRRNKANRNRTRRNKNRRYKSKRNKSKRNKK